MAKVGRPTKYIGIIYSLSDGSGIKYIGQTVNRKRRLSVHCSYNQNAGDSHLNKWITNLCLENKKPVMNTIEETNDLDEREIYWISFYKEQGIELLNMTDGGINNLYSNNIRKEQPWGNTQSPVQRRLNNISKYINFLIRHGDLHKAEAMRLRKDDIALLIKNIGKDKINICLYDKYGY